ncbi:MAG: imelysin family protein, partial [Methylobacteriaceae bacterium]|nr:imelysin family protein [Methylobacteriaceae bacterium]
AWRGFCRAPTAGGTAGLAAAFRATADAWSGIEFVRYGPILEANRIERIAHWPERGNAVGRAISALVAGTGELTPERLAGSSAAGQGLTALERLLFEGEEPGRVFLEPGPVAAQRCAVASAIATNVARIARETLEGWQQPNGALDRLSTGGPEERGEAATRLATELLAALEFIADAKLGAPMGKSDAEGARPTLAEGWRSGRSLRAIRLELDGIAALARPLIDPATDEGSSAAAGLATARSVAADLGDASLGDLAADPDRRASLLLLRNAVLGARELLGPALVQTLDVTIGFNSQDGD